VRLFVAVRPPPEVLGVLAGLERPAVEGVRWTAPPQWHVTLRFLGEVPAGEVDEVAASLTDAAVGLEPADVVVGDRLASFGPSVLHVPVEGLEAWAAAIACALAPADAPGEAFVGHVTLARGRRGRGAARGDVRPLVGRSLPSGPRRWVADGFTLVQSELDHDGARYSTVAAFAVGGDHPHTNVRSQIR
jgi:2'-5' RNA ligase